MKIARRSLLVVDGRKRVKSNTISFKASKQVTDADKVRAATSQAATSKSEKSRDLILESAAKLFRRQGFSATTLRQIAAMARDQGRQHLLLFQFQGSDSETRFSTADFVTGLRRGQDGAESSRQGLASPADRPCHRGASRGAARNQRFHLRQYPHLRPAARAPQETAAPVAHVLMPDIGTSSSWTRGVRAKFVPTSKSCRCGSLCWAR